MQSEAPLIGTGAAMIYVELATKHFVTKHCILERMFSEQASCYIGCPEVTEGKTAIPKEKRTHRSGTNYLRLRRVGVKLRRRLATKERVP